MLRIERGEAAGYGSLRQVGRFADIFQRSDEIVKELDRDHDGISTATHILGDFDELAALVLFQIKKKNLSIREDFLRMNGAFIGASFFTVVTDHGLPPQHLARAFIGARPRSGIGLSFPAFISSADAGAKTIIFL